MSRSAREEKAESCVFFFHCFTGFSFTFFFFFQHIHSMIYCTVLDDIAAPDAISVAAQARARVVSTASITKASSSTG